MQDKITYEFAVIRVVPKVEREEFINVGVILFSKPKRFIGMKFQIDESRLKSFSADIDCNQLANYLNAWELVCKGGTEGGPIGQMDVAYRFRWLTANRSTIIQSSKVHPGLCSNPETVLDDLFRRYVL